MIAWRRPGAPPPLEDCVAGSYYSAARSAPPRSEPLFLILYSAARSAPPRSEPLFFNALLSGSECPPSLRAVVLILSQPLTEQVSPATPIPGLARAGGATRRPLSSRKLATQCHSLLGCASRGPVAPAAASPPIALGARARGAPLLGFG